VAMMDTVFSVLEGSVVIRTLLGVNPQRLGNASQIAVPYDVYKAKDGDIAIGCPNDSLFAKLAKVMEREDLLTDERYSTNIKRVENRDDLDAIITAWCQERDKLDIEGMLNEARIPSAPIKTMDELIDDPHIAARNMLIEQEDPILGKVKYPGNPLKLSETPAVFARRAPQLGEHNEEVLAEVLGYSADVIAAMKTNGDI
jgi:Predicted acyl-CoA transferases/carnitine dehydratase